MSIARYIDTLRLPPAPDVRARFSDLSGGTRRRFLFFSWGAQQVNFWTAAQKLKLNTGFYAPLREAVRHKLGADALDYISALSV